MLAPMLLLAALACAAPHELLAAAASSPPAAPGVLSIPEPHEHFSILRDARAAAARARHTLDYDGIRLFGDTELAGGGWRWLSVGEGAVTFRNASLPHRPAAFPDWLPDDANLPVRGVLVPFVNLAGGDAEELGELWPPSTDESRLSSTSLSSPETSADPINTDTDTHPTNDDNYDGHEHNPASLPSWEREPPERACIPIFRPRAPRKTDQIALIERGGCDFATKVIAAQARGAVAVIVGDSVARRDETDEEGRGRENLITMFSPDTSGIVIPSVFVSRASYLLLRDLLRNSTVNGRPGLFLEIGEVTDDGNALGSLLTFALLMPSLFLIATVAAHRVRVARQREANRAPPTVVLSLPERVWGPDIVWEKDDSDSDKETSDDEGAGVADGQGAGADASTAQGAVAELETGTGLAADDSDVAVAVSDLPLAPEDGEGADSEAAASQLAQRRRGKQRRKSKRYYSKDECAICMDNFQKGEVVRILPCGHVFHKDECDEWLLKWRKLCPTCRADVTLPAGDLMASATLTPVVDRREGAAAPIPVYGAAGADPVQIPGGPIDRFGARVSSAVNSVAGSVRDSVRRLVAGYPSTQQQQHQQQTERTPLVVHDV